MHVENVQERHVCRTMSQTTAVRSTSFQRGCENKDASICKDSSDIRHCLSTISTIDHLCSLWRTHGDLVRVTLGQRGYCTLFSDWMCQPPARLCGFFSQCIIKTTNACRKCPGTTCLQNNVSKNCCAFHILPKGMWTKKRKLAKIQVTFVTVQLE